MKTIRIYDIIWDTDDSFESYMVDLPCEVFVKFDEYDEDDLVNYLSDTYGWCVYEYKYEEIENNI